MADEAILTTFLRKLEVRDVVTDAEKRALIACAGETAHFDAGTDLVREGDRPDTSILLLDGFCSRYRDTPDGSRQITAIHVAGDFVDLHSLLLGEMDHSVGALSTCRAMRFPHERLRALTETHPHLTRLLWLMTLIDASIHRQWLAAAARSAPEQLAHLVCELFVRLEISGLVGPDRSFALPLTQVELSEALGLSAVHVNRSLQQLRAEGLLSWQNQTVHILDWGGLQRRGSFEDRYLHLVREPR
jgi:CRP-like cAMP-binding protein